MKSNERGNAIAVSREAMPRNANYLSPLPFHASIISNRTKLQIIINIKCDKCPNHPTPYKKIPSIRISTLHEPSWESLHLRHRSAGGAISLHPTARAVGNADSPLSPATSLGMALPRCAQAWAQAIHKLPQPARTTGNLI